MSTLQRRHLFLWIMFGIGSVSWAQAESKLTPLKTGGGRPLESLKAKKEPKVSEAPKPAKKETPKSVPQFTGPKTGWGIVSVATPFYNEAGSHQGKLRAGTLVSYSGVKQSTKSYVLISKIQRQADMWEGPVLVEAPDVVLFSGVLEEMPGKLLADLKAFYTLQGRIAARKEQLEEEAQAKNPHLERAKQAQARYADSVERAGVMEQQANALKGSAKSKMLDELRSLKYEQARLKTEADQEAHSYKAWKEQNPISPTLFSTDAELKALKAQLKEAKEKIKDVVVDE